MARKLGFYLIATLGFTTLAVMIASAEELPHDFLIGSLAAALLLVGQPLLLWMVAHGTGRGWRI